MRQGDSIKAGDSYSKPAEDRYQREIVAKAEGCAYRGCAQVSGEQEVEEGEAC